MEVNYDYCYRHYSDNHFQQLSNCACRGNQRAVLTIKQGGMYSRAVLIKRDLSTAEVTATEIAWTLTQEETLSLDPKAQAQVCMNFLTNTGLRGTSKAVNCHIEDNPLKEVMT